MRFNRNLPSAKNENTPAAMPQGCHFTLINRILDQSRNATDAIALDWFSVFIATRCQPHRWIVA